MSRKVIIKKFELESEIDAEKLVIALNKGKYFSIKLGKGVVSRCRQTKKLEKIIKPFTHSEYIPSEYDINKINSI